MSASATQGGHNNNNSNSQDDVHGAVIMASIVRVYMTMQTEIQVAANLQTKSNNLGCDAAGWLLPSTSTIAICYYYSAPSLIHFVIPQKMD